MTNKHSKYKNSGLIFELLVRKLTSDTLSQKDSKAVKILKEFYSNTEISKEYKLYKTLIETQSSDITKINYIIDSILNESKKINKTSIKREKYNLVKEIKNNYNLDEFFQTQIPNYKIHASIYNLIEAYNSSNFINPENIIKNRETLVEHILITKKSSDIKPNDILQEYSTQSKDIRILTYKILLEKFNQKFSSLDIEQKQVLKEYINNIAENPKLKKFINEKYSDVKDILNKSLLKIEDKSIKIKIQEIISFAQEIPKSSKVKDKDILNLLQFLELKKEIINVI